VLLSAKIKPVGALEHVLFSPIVGMMIQSDELHHFSGGLVETTNKRYCPCRFIDPFYEESKV
jgi:hypothetical protein